MTTATKVYRQGDVLLVKVDKLPAKAAKIERKAGERLVLAYGERTGHAHAMRSDKVVAFKVETAEDRALAGLPQFDYIQVGGSAPVALAHEYEDGRKAEHTPIEIEPGTYRVSAQVEYSPQAIQRVSD